MSEYRIAILGDGGTGKSAIIFRQMNNVFVEDSDPTFEDVYKAECEIDGTKCTLQILEAASREVFHNPRVEYMQAGDGYMIVFSLSWIHSIESLEENHMGEILHARKIKMERYQFDKDIELPPMILVAAKKDLASERVVPQSEIDALCAKYRMKCFETSALTGEGVREAFEGLIRCIKERNPPADKKSKLQAASAKKDAKSGSRANCAIQ